MMMPPGIRIYPPPAEKNTSWWQAENLKLTRTDYTKILCTRLHTSLLTIASSLIEQMRSSPKYRQTQSTFSSGRYPSPCDTYMKIKHGAESSGCRFIPT